MDERVMTLFASAIAILLMLVLGAAAIAGILAGYWFIARAAWRAVLEG